tara:strand:- start:635 stop:1054 length:420 start_codon:yes stop_codon:yes gene_type:complete
MPYNCEGWAQSCGTESFDIVNDGNAVAMNDYFLFDLFALDNYWHNIIIIDDDMVFRHFISTCEPTFPNVSTLQESIEEILFEMDYIIGDINYDGVLNILDVVFLANGILDGTYDWYSDINQDQIINIQDIILLVNLILT